LSNLRFEHDAPAARVLFGGGRFAEVAAEALRLGSRVLLVASGSQAARAEELAAALGDARAATILGVREHVPAETADEARRRAAESGADVVVALGGGSAIGLAKAIALTARLPILAVPTTYSGSECTRIWGISAGGRKQTGSDPVVAPRTIVYDPDLTHGLPPATTAASGMNAVAHCAEALWLERAMPFSDALATAGLARLASGLRRAVAAPDDAPAREEALAGAWLAGCALAAVGTGLHHKLCHVLGGLGLPHGPTHAVLLPSVAEAVGGRASRTIARSLGEGDDGAAALHALAAALGTPTSLGELGLEHERLPEAADEAAAAGVAPRDVVLAILERAFDRG
jgi:maleylacetate reductase